MTGFANINKGKIYYEVKGEGTPLVFVHGNTLNSKMWDDQFDYFSKNFKAIRYDMRGFGKSDLPTGKYSRHEDLKLLLEYLNIPKAIIVGLSLGGDVAIDFALEYPKLPLKLVLVDSGIGHWNFTKEFSKSWAKVEKVAKKDMLKAKEMLINHALFAPAIRNEISKDKLKAIVDEYSGWFFVNENPHARPKIKSINRLNDIDKETLIIVGEHDLPDFKSISYFLNDSIQNSTLKVMKDVGHMSNMEDPKEFNRILEEFLT